LAKSWYNGQSKLDNDHPKDYKIFLVKMVNPNLIMTISTIPDLFVVEIVLIYVNFDHKTKFDKFDQNGHFDHEYFENPRVLWSWLDPSPN
jgi:hypothetical protein